LEYLQRNMEQLNGKHTDGDTALIASAMANNESVVRFLLGQKSALELNCKDTDGATALMHAVAHQCQQRSLCECECPFTLLVDANANLTKKDNSGW
jgi:ankyrin repeat protein